MLLWWCSFLVTCCADPQPFGITRAYSSRGRARSGGPGSAPEYPGGRCGATRCGTRSISTCLLVSNLALRYSLLCCVSSTQTGRVLPLCRRALSPFSPAHTAVLLEVMTFLDAHDRLSLAGMGLPHLVEAVRACPPMGLVRGLQLPADMLRLLFPQFCLPLILPEAERDRDLYRAPEYCTDDEGQLHCFTIADPVHLAVWTPCPRPSPAARFQLPLGRLPCSVAAAPARSQLYVLTRSPANTSLPQCELLVLPLPLPPPTAESTLTVLRTISITAPDQDAQLHASDGGVLVLRTQSELVLLDPTAEQPELGRGLIRSRWSSAAVDDRNRIIYLGSNRAITAVPFSSLTPTVPPPPTASPDQWRAYFQTDDKGLPREAVDTAPPHMTWAFGDRFESLGSFAWDTRFESLGRMAWDATLQLLFVAAYESNSTLPPRAVLCLSADGLLRRRYVVSSGKTWALGSFDASQALALHLARAAEHQGQA